MSEGRRCLACGGEGYVTLSYHPDGEAYQNDCGLCHQDAARQEAARDRFRRWCDLDKDDNKAHGDQP